MAVNVGGVDRSVRLVIGLALLMLGAFGVLKGVAALLGYVVAAIALVTAFIRFCPLWAVCRINTTKTVANKTN